MSIYYSVYPIADTNISGKITREKLEKATDFDYVYSISDHSLSETYIIEGLRGNIPQILSYMLEEVQADEEDDVKIDEYEEIIGILDKIGTDSDQFVDNDDFENYLGYITFEEVKMLGNFIKEFVFENNDVEEIKKAFLTVLTETAKLNKGLVVTYA